MIAPQRLGLWAWLLVVALANANASARAEEPSGVDPASSATGQAMPYKGLSLQELMDIEVTSVTRSPEKLSESPSAIQVVTGEDIRRSGASSIPEALRLASNLQVAQKNSHDWGISARGFNTELANKLLVLMDGRTVYTPLYSGVFWDVQDYLLEDIDRIEVVSGPGGTLWGANAVNGVINITTKSAKDTQGFYSEVGGGTWLQDFVGLRYGGALATNVFFRVYGKYFGRDDETQANGLNAGDSWQKGQGGFRVDAEVSAQDNFTLQGDFYRGDEDMPGGGTARVAGGNVLSRWTHTFSEESDLSLQVYYDRTHLALPKPPTGTLEDDLDTYDVDFQHRFALGERHRLVWGLGYRFTHDQVENAPTVAFLPTTLNQDLFSGFVQDEIKLLDQLFFTLGTKLEHNDYTGLEVEPSARLQWHVTDAHLLWSAVSRAVRTPSRIDRDLLTPSGLPAPLPSSILNGSSDFDSESVIAYEVGHRAQLDPKLVTSIALFFNDYHDVRSTTPGPIAPPNFGFPLTFANNLEGETYGFELSATYQLLDWWRLRGGYNLLEEHLRVKPGQADFSNALNETADPEQQFSLRSSMDLPHDVGFDAGLRWVDTLHNNNGPNPGTVPDYFELDVRLAWRPSKQWELSVVGQNLLHDRHPEYGFPGATRVEMGRSVYGKVAFWW